VAGITSARSHHAGGFRHGLAGLRLGVHCSMRCVNLTAILVAIGIMDLRAMAVVTAAITPERLAPSGGWWYARLAPAPSVRVCSSSRARPGSHSTSSTVSTAARLKLPPRSTALEG